MPRFLSIITLLCFIPCTSAQNPDPAKLTLDRIYNTSDFRGESGPAVKWLEGNSYTSLEASGTIKAGQDIVRYDGVMKVDILVAAEKLIPTGAKEPLRIDAYELSKDLDLLLIYTNSARVWRQNTRGDYWTFRRSTGKLAKLGGDAKPSTLQFAKISPDGSRVGYVRENNIFVEPAESGTPVKITTDGTDEIINGTFDWVYEEEFFCRDGWRWSPDGKQIAYWQIDVRGVKTFTMVDNTSNSYPVLKTFAYPKTGERNSLCRIGVIAFTGGVTKWMDIPGDTKVDYYIPRMEWADGSKELVIQRINRLQNADDVMLVEVESGQARKIHSDRDGAWVDIHDDALAWLDKGASFTWISEQDGWRHLSVISRDGVSVRKVSTGEFDLIRVLHIDEKGGRVYYFASPDNPTQQYLYRCSLTSSGKVERLTPTDQPGWHDYQISPGGDIAIHTYSSFGVPPRIELIHLPDHKVIKVFAANEKLKQTIEKLARTPVEFFKADVDGGVQLDGWLMKPPGFDPAKKYPIIFHVYGEPAGQSVVDRWGGTEYLWHLMLTQQGYLVACIDNRGTPCPRGRDWRKIVYRRVGTFASEDQAAALRFMLKKHSFIDPARVGVWGWSGGGSMTLNLMFRSPDLYRLGMAIAPVPDMKLYDSIYQERYMGLPQDNPEDYRLGSPITHAAGLKGSLLVIHGSGDDNCHYQGTEKLIGRLIELNKPFTMMEYPNRSHSIDEGKNTRWHLFALLTRFLNDNLPAGGR